MQIKLGDLKNAEQALRKLSQAQLPIKTSYKLGKALKSIGDELQDFETKRIELVKKYGEETPTGDTQVKQESIQDFIKDMQDLSDIIVDIDTDKVKLSSLEGVKFSPSEVVSMEMFIEDDSVKTVTVIPPAVPTNSN